MQHVKKLIFTVESIVYFFFLHDGNIVPESWVYRGIPYSINSIIKIQNQTLNAKNKDVHLDAFLIRQEKGVTFSIRNKSVSRQRPHENKHIFKNMATKKPPIRVWPIANHHELYISSSLALFSLFRAFHGNNSTRNGLPSSVVRG